MQSNPPAEDKIASPEKGIAQVPEETRGRDGARLHQPLSNQERDQEDSHASASHSCQQRRANDEEREYQHEIIRAERRSEQEIAPHGTCFGRTRSHPKKDLGRQRGHRVGNEKPQEPAANDRACNGLIRGVEIPGRSKKSGDSETGNRTKPEFGAGNPGVPTGAQRVDQNHEKNAYALQRVNLGEAPRTGSRVRGAHPLNPIISMRAR